MWSPEPYFIQAFLLCAFLIFALILTLTIVVFAAILLKPPSARRPLRPVEDDFPPGQEAWKSGRYKHFE